MPSVEDGISSREKARYLEYIDRMEQIIAKEYQIAVQMKERAI